MRAISELVVAFVLASACGGKSTERVAAASTPPAQGPLTRTVTISASTGTIRLANAAAPGTFSDCAAPQTCTFGIEDGVRIVLMPIVNGTGWAVERWSGGCATATPTCELAVDRDISVRLEVRMPELRSVKLTIASGQGSLVVTGTEALSPVTKSCDSSCTIAVDATTEIRAGASPGDGFVFAGYGGACSGMECAVTPQGEVEIVARFAPSNVDEPRYDVEVITDAAGEMLAPSALGNDGSMSGATCGQDGCSIFVWKDRAASRIPVLRGKSAWIAATEGGHFVGTIKDARGGGPVHAFADGRDIGTLGGTDSLAKAVDRSGLVAGVSTTANGELHAFAWSKGAMEDIGPRTGKRNSVAFAIDDLGGIIVAACDQVSNFEGCRTVRLGADGSTSDLETPPDFFPVAMSTNGNAVAGDELWRAGQTIALQPILERAAWPSLHVLAGQGPPRAMLTNVNEAGDAVGEICFPIDEDCQRSGILIHQGTAAELNGLLTDPSLQIHFAFAINRRGQILADTYVVRGRYVLLTPR